MMRTPPFDRLRFVRFAVLLVLAVLLVRLWQLQVVRGDSITASEEQRLVRIPIAGARVKYWTGTGFLSQPASLCLQSQCLGTRMRRCSLPIPVRKRSSSVSPIC